MQNYNHNEMMRFIKTCYKLVGVINITEEAINGMMSLRNLMKDAEYYVY